MLSEEYNMACLQFNANCDVEHLEKLKGRAEIHMKFSKIYLPMLNGMGDPLATIDTQKNYSPWKAVKEGSYFLGNAHRLVEVYKSCIPGAIENAAMQSINDTLVKLEFDPKHISRGYTDEAYGGTAECFVSKGQGTMYYNLLHSDLYKDVRSFIEMVKVNIDVPVMSFLSSINQRLPFAYYEMLVKAIKEGNAVAVGNYIKKGAILYLKDKEGRTPLHHAVNNGNIDIVSSLLQNKANVVDVTNRDNTALHIAASKGYREVVELLLQYVSRDELNDFINAKTTSGGTTSLHVAAKNGFLEVVKSLLKHGATYNIVNKEGKTPVNISTDQEIANVFRFVEELFNDAKSGNFQIINKLRTVKQDEFVAATNARNKEGNTILQVAIFNNHKNIAIKLGKLLKETNLQGVENFCT